MKNLKLVHFAMVWVALIFFFVPGISMAKKSHEVFFEGTDYELHVYRSFGKEPGKTLLLIGGIQGDEPGGFLSADLYADISLIKGNLIVVPRANFNSIVLKRRQINDDMNRKFGLDTRYNYEAKVVSILKKLIAQSDMLLNLHDGSGFYTKSWQDQYHNPMRCGQSIIADCETFQDSSTTRPIRLGEMARKVAREINSKIKDPIDHFHFNNHDTKKINSRHKAQRKSATYYALYSCHIPAFGIETSKSLPLSKKVRQHNLAINGFMELLGIIPETPGVRTDHPNLRYLIISVNDSLPILVENQQTLYIKPGDKVMISHIEANYERGLTADILGVGAINDVRKRLEITRPTRIVVRKDFYACGSVYLALSQDAGKFSHGVSVSKKGDSGPSYVFFKIKINGEERIFANNDLARIVRGDRLEIADLVTNICDPSELVANFKGFVGDKSNNTGEDRGYVIDTAKDLWPNYSDDKKGKLFHVVVKRGRDEVGRLFVELSDPSLNYLVFRTGAGVMNCFNPGDTAVFKLGNKVELVDIITNVKGNKGIKAYIAGHGKAKKMVGIKRIIPFGNLGAGREGDNSSLFRVDVLRDEMHLGSVFLKFNGGDAT